MKIAIDAGYGVFMLPKSLQKKLHCDEWGFTRDKKYVAPERTDPDLIKAIEEDPNCSLKVVHIPDNATDWVIDQHSFYKEVIAVVDGKIIHIY